MTEQIRIFAGGATRDTDINKPNYVKALSPIALQYYVKEYLGKHRVQSDGSLRDWDNWKHGMPQNVYLDGLGRHEMAVWLLCQGFPASDNHGPVTLKDSLCGVIFAAHGMLHQLLHDELLKEEKFTCPSNWKIEFENGCGDDDCGWFAEPRFQPYSYLQKDLTLHNDTGWRDHKFGEAPGYWPTKEATEDALKQYLEKQ